MNRPPINSRLKGAGAERELAGLVYEHLGVRLERRLDQARGGGFDLELAPAGQTGPVADTLASLAIEVKRHAVITPAMLAGFWNQATRQADAAGLIPCLAWRQNRNPWRVTLPLAWLVPGTAKHPPGLEFAVTMYLDGFFMAVRER